jgi:uncharacterized protein GlcG (DUF336 family)
MSGQQGYVGWYAGLEMGTDNKDADSATFISTQPANFLAQTAASMNTNTAQVNVALQQLAQQNSQLHQQQQALQAHLAAMMGGKTTPGGRGRSSLGTNETE